MLLLHNNDNHGERRLFDCADCSYIAWTMDELIMQENMKHNSLNVPVNENDVDEILDLTAGKRKQQYGNQTN